jgi:hypothetical protein
MSTSHPDCTRLQQSIPIYVLRGSKFSVEKEREKFKEDQ